MLNTFKSRAMVLALATSLSFGSIGGVSAANARSMPYQPAQISAQSPFKAFAGQGRGWKIDIRSHGHGDHSVVMKMRDGSQWRGTLRYSGPVMDMSSNFVVMSGELRNGLAMLPITVEINQNKVCKVMGKKMKNAISVHGADDQVLRGCGKSIRR